MCLTIQFAMCLSQIDNEVLLFGGVALIKEWVALNYRRGGSTCVDLMALLRRITKIVIFYRYRLSGLPVSNTPDRRY